jgi:hypothetical protein
MTDEEAQRCCTGEMRTLTVVASTVVALGTSKRILRPFHPTNRTCRTSYEAVLRSLWSLPVLIRLLPMATGTKGIDSLFCRPVACWHLSMPKDTLYSTRDGGRKKCRRKDTVRFTSHDVMAQIVHGKRAAPSTAQLRFCRNKAIYRWNSKSFVVNPSYADG